MESETMTALFDRFQVHTYLQTSIVNADVGRPCKLLLLFNFYLDPSLSATFPSRFAPVPSKTSGNKVKGLHSQATLQTCNFLASSCNDPAEVVVCVITRVGTEVSSFIEILLAPNNHNTGRADVIVLLRNAFETRWLDS